MRADSSRDAGGRDGDCRDRRADPGAHGRGSAADACPENGREGDGRGHDEDPCPIVRMSVCDAAGEAAAPMDTEDQCKMLMDWAQGDPDSHVGLFMSSLSNVVGAVGERMRRSRTLGRRISRERMARYEAEFDTWHSYTVRVLMSCRDDWTPRLLNVMHLADLCLSAEWDYAEGRLTETLADLYKDDAWNTFVRDYLEFGAPEEHEYDLTLHEAAGDSRHAQTSAPDRINLYLTVLEKAGSDPGRVLGGHWMADERICTRYLQYLLRHGRGSEAGRVASVGLELFPRGVRVAAAALGALDPGDAGALRARCVLYAADPASEHYGAAKASAHWDAGWARRLADMLAARGEHGAEIVVLTEAGMRAEALDALRYDGTLRMAISHSRTLAASDPDGYYDACRALVTGAPKRGAGKAQHAMILQCLRIMKAIPGHESDFGAMCESMIRDERAVPAALRKSIRKVVGP
ncbi:MAG: hypothetical protein OXI27_00350 [Thaumarchaeota archaeon]|nr:hypothetical protein [Nitrososphaerota archaeon]